VSPQTLTALVVDDEPQMLDIVSFALETQGFDTVTAKDAESAWQVFKDRLLDLLVLDVMLPHASGLALCRRIREVSEVPIIMLTARGESADRVSGLESGADDYVIKPFHPRELALRAEAIVRRTQPRAAATVLHHGPLRVESDRASVHGRYLNLSPTELRLLTKLLQNMGGMVTFADLLLAGWRQAEGPGGREMLKTALYRLRQRLAAEGYPRAIKAIRGTGYQLLPFSD
jgi:DNA-binding response OmpR family regulator